MGHRVEHDVDSHRIGFGFGKVFEVILVVPFALPAVAEVSVMTGEHHDALLVIENSAVMYCLGPAAASPLESDACELAAGAPVHTGHLWFFLEVEYAVEDRVVHRQFRGLTIGKYPLQFLGEVFP